MEDQHPHHKRCSVFLNGGRPGEGRVLLVRDSTSWPEFLHILSEKMREFQQIELDLNHQQQEGREKNERDDKGRKEVRRVWLASTGVQLENVNEIEDGDSLCVSFDPAEIFNPTPFISCVLHTSSHSFPHLSRLYAI